MNSSVAKNETLQGRSRRYKCVLQDIALLELQLGNAIVGFAIEQRKFYAHLLQSAK
jgi:hypothetical protein